MNYIQTEIDGVWLIEPKVFFDERGYFMEAFKKEEFESHIGPVNFVQDNESKSSFGVLRGLHYQKGEYSQAKLVRVIKGEVLDVAVDLRKSSPTFGKYVSVLLSEENKRQFFIPRGFAHGFAVLSEEAVFTYKVDNKYAPQAEASILYNDEEETCTVSSVIPSSIVVASFLLGSDVGFFSSPLSPFHIKLITITVIINIITSTTKFSIFFFIHKAPFYYGNIIQLVVFIHNRTGYRYQTFTINSLIFSIYL